MKPPIGDRLWIQMADFRFSKRVMVIPLNKDQMTDTPWVEGTCIKAMGTSLLMLVTALMKSLPRNARVIITEDL